MILNDHLNRKIYHHVYHDFYHHSTTLQARNVSLTHVSSDKIVGYRWLFAEKRGDYTTQS